MRIVKLLLYGVFPVFYGAVRKKEPTSSTWRCGRLCTVSGTATNFLTSSKAYDFEASWLSGIYSSRFNDGDGLYDDVRTSSNQDGGLGPVYAVIPVEVVTGMLDVPSLPCGVKAVREITVFLPCWYISPERMERSSRTMGVCFMTRLFMG